MDVDHGKKNKLIVPINVVVVIYLTTEQRSRAMNVLINVSDKNMAVSSGTRFQEKGVGP